MGANAALFDFMIGDWRADFHLLPPGVTVGRRAIATVKWFLDGTAMLDEWRHLDESGAVVFRGATFRTYLPDKDQWYALWMTPGIAGFSELHIRGVDNEVRTSGAGTDPVGAFVERGRYYHISDNAFSFALERSYDDGASFTPFVAFHAERDATRTQPAT